MKLQSKYGFVTFFSYNHLSIAGRDFVTSESEDCVTRDAPSPCIALLTRQDYMVLKSNGAEKNLDQLSLANEQLLCRLECVIQKTHVIDSDLYLLKNR